MTCIGGHLQLPRVKGRTLQFAGYERLQISRAGFALCARLSRVPKGPD